MAQDDMLTVFCYDVSADKKRRRVAKLLEDIANRVQFSVFETRMGRREAEAVSQRVAAELGPGDSLRVYVIGKNGERRTHVYGDATPLMKDQAYWIF